MSEINDLSAAAEITSACHLIPLDPGLYSLELVPGTPSIVGGLPAARVSSPPGPPGRREIVSVSAFRTDGWLGVTDPPTLIRITEQRSPVMVTLYWPAASGPGGGPNLQITRVVTEPAGSPAQPARALPMGASDPELIVHIQGHGDIGGRIGDWAGQRGSGLAIEGFSLTPRLGLMVQDVEYRALIGRDRLSPWLPGGHFCGSRGLNLPLLGFCIRLRGTAASRYDLVSFARFVDGTETGPIAADHLVCAESLAPLEALQIIPRPRGF